MKKKVVKLGWIGSGFVGQVAHLFSFNNIPDVKIVALSELRPKLGHLVCKKYSIPNYYSDHKELLKRNDLDGVVAIVRRYHTAPLAKEILKKGFNLFTEKPMAATFVQAKSLVQISNKQKLKYIIGNMRRHDEGVLIAKKYFEKYKKSKELGEIISFRTFCFAGGDSRDNSWLTRAGIPKGKSEKIGSAPRHSAGAGMQTCDSWGGVPIEYYPPGRASI